MMVREAAQARPPVLLRSNGRVLLLPALVLFFFLFVLLPLGGWGASNTTQIGLNTASVTLVANGASSLLPLFVALGNDYQKSRDDVGMSYVSFTSTREATSSYLSGQADLVAIHSFTSLPANLTGGSGSATSDLLYVPVAAAAIVPVHNALPCPSLGKLVLSCAVLGSIWAGDITSWSDARIVSYNPACSTADPATSAITLALAAPEGDDLEQAFVRSLADCSPTFNSALNAAQGNTSRLPPFLSGGGGTRVAGDRIAWLGGTAPAGSLSMVLAWQVPTDPSSVVKGALMVDLVNTTLQGNASTAATSLNAITARFNNGTLVDPRTNPYGAITGVSRVKDGWPLCAMVWVAFYPDGRSRGPVQSYGNAACPNTQELLGFLAYTQANSATTGLTIPNAKFAALPFSWTRTLLDRLGTVECGGTPALVQSYIVATGVPAAVTFQRMALAYNSGNYRVKFISSLTTIQAINGMIDGQADFSAVTFVPTAEQMAKVPDVVLVPMQVVAMAPIYHIPELLPLGGSRPLYFTWSIMAGIFLGNITMWNDPNIADIQDPEVAALLPAQPILIAYQTLPSVIAGAFTLALSRMNDTFNDTIGATQTIKFPVMQQDPNRTIAVSGPIVPQTMQSRPYSFSLWPVASSLQGAFNIIAGGLIDPAGQRILPNVSTLENTFVELAPFMANASASLPDAPFLLLDKPGAWPIIQWTFFMVHTRIMTSVPKAKTLVEWMYWMLTSDLASVLAQQNYVIMTGSSSPILMRRSLKMIVNVTVNGVPVSPLYGCVAPDGSLCSDHGVCSESACVCNQPWQGEFCSVYPSSSSSSDDLATIVPAVVVPVVVLTVLLFLLILIVAIVAASRRARKAALANSGWEIDMDELEMGEPLGAGGYGSVYKAMWKGTEVAVKMIGNGKAKPTPDEQKRFREEVGTMTALRHPNVVLFMAACTKPPKMCIVMEYMGLGSLYDLLHNDLIADLPAVLCIRLAYQAAKGMHFLHSSGVVHRDLKSLNILLDAKWNAKVSDFGLTRLAGESRSATGKDEVEGTVQWLAPEVLGGQGDVDMVLSDVYAFGIILWELLTREQPYGNLSQAAVAVAVLRDNARPQMPASGSIFGANYADYEQLIHDCWDKEPMVRPTFLEIMTRLGQLVDSDSSTSASTRYKGGGTTGTTTSSSSSSSSSMTLATDRTGDSRTGGGAGHRDGSSTAAFHDQLRHSQPPIPEGSSVSAVVTDIYRADLLWDEAPRLAKEAIEEHDRILRKHAAVHNGYESLFAGGGPQEAGRNGPGGGTFCFVFAHVDQALDFCRDAQRALLAAPWDRQLLDLPQACDETAPDGQGNDDALIFAGPRVRMGVHVGRLRAKLDPLTRRYNYAGPAIYGAAAMAQAAQGGRVLVSAEVKKAMQQQGDRFKFGTLESSSVQAMQPKGGPTLRLHANEMYTVPGRYFDRCHLGGGVSGVYDDDKIQHGGHGDSGGGGSSSGGGGVGEDDGDVVHHGGLFAGGAMHSKDTLLGTSNACKFMLNFAEIKLNEEIGTGTYGVVYRGKWKGVDVAVKRFLNQKSNRMEYQAEVAVLSAARHPNIVLFIGACMQAPNICIVTEWVSSGNLRELLAHTSTKISWRARVEIIRGIASGLHYLHTGMDAGAVIHRDLKSSNVLVVPDNGMWTAKLADFGFARTKDEMNTMTRCGTPAWTAPEIIAGEKYSEKADIYSMGIIMWEVLTRRRPYADANFISLSLDVLGGKRPEIPSSCPPTYRKVMKRCWHKNPAKRPFADQVALELIQESNEPV